MRSCAEVAFFAFLLVGALGILAMVAVVAFSG
jgi:hypothetical protein